MPHPLSNVTQFYLQGFRSMRLGRTLWRLILIKLAILFMVAKLFLPNHLQQDFSSDQDRAASVLQHLTERPVR